MLHRILSGSSTTSSAMRRTCRSTPARDHCGNRCAGNQSADRPAGRDKRELVIGHGVHGNLALYCHVAQIGTMFVLAVRSQREAGFAGP
ncbi:hypothetical protein [Xanthomonas arboricola]|uniref:hypothetical protein n=1 Tax=Xanthomonas arboricola TaxID=56448 RepID=UPI003EBF81E4